MQVKVVSHARSGHATQIHSHVESLGVVRLSQSRLATFRQIHQLICGFLWRRIQLSEMVVRSDHQVTTDVRVAVEDYKIECAAMNDETLFVICAALSITEDAR